MKRLLLEGLLVALLGAILSLVANGISPRGLKLTRNYFPESKPALPAPAGSTNLPAHAGGVSTNSLEQLAGRLRDKGMHLADSNRVVELFHDPRRQQDLVIFIDARDEEHYDKGHVPGAYLFDYYHPENYLATVLPACQVAEDIVVYCNGGDCEDSELASTFLRDAGIPPVKLWVYGGGMSEWSTNGLPVEIGQRQSGQFLPKPQ